ncbi:uncharacterized protein LOC125270812 isoform X1 [Megalobrama amblycephala]|uniref:uncharacterized protein LOC125270812 isoform X1 n=1 Tax=Megalobrama amblycephala TaxID=75352 RepID=UPI002013CDDD|nr:uncharacterized protein LOC125270812 isoform X1 [Megalobrama amblycephala]
MAEEAFLDRESLRCSICQDLFRNPVIIPCGHSFCKDCITRLWDQGMSRCPQCKQTFNNRPDWLHAKELSEKLMKMRTRAEEEAEDVSCDSCSSTTTKAIRSCLTCLASYCSTHLEQHDELHARRKHQLTDATDLQNKICSQHGKLIDIFCRTDQQCVCVLCALYEHKSHDTISASDERADRQRKLMETRVKFLQNIQDREKDYKELTQTKESIRRSAQTAVTESERIFSEVLQSLQKTSCRVKELIADQQRAELNHIEGVQEKVQQKIADMKMKVSELDQFMTTEDHIHFLQNYPSDCEESMSEEFEDLSSISEHPDAFFHNVTMLVSKMQERLLDVTKTTEIEIKIKSVKVLPPVGGIVKLSETPAFGKKDERWNCDICLVTNEGTTSHCVACHEPKPNMKSKFCFGSFANQRAATLFKDSGLRFQKDQSKGDQSKGNASTAIESCTIQTDLTCSMSSLASTCGFDFGNASSSVFKFDVEQYKKKENEAFTAADKTSHDGNPFSTSSDLCGSVQLDQKNVFRFGELVKGFNFSFQYVPSKSTSVLNQSEASCPDDEEETYEPAVPLPDVIEISTGEENEQVVFSHKAKLYRFDKELLQWKERGVGELKILENDKPRRARLVMRREQVLKLCANHWITPNMKLEPMKASENAWTWNAFDFADGEGRDQTLAVRFKLQESADAFRKIFEEAVATASSLPERGERL